MLLLLWSCLSLVHDPNITPIYTLEYYSSFHFILHYPSITPRYYSSFPLSSMIPPIHGSEGGFGFHACFAVACDSATLVQLSPKDDDEDNKNNNDNKSKKGKVMVMMMMMMMMTSHCMPHDFSFLCCFSQGIRMRVVVLKTQKLRHKMWILPPLSIWDSSCYDCVRGSKDLQITRFC